jgi:hypothetical protein
MKLALVYAIYSVPFIMIGIIIWREVRETRRQRKANAAKLAEFHRLGREARRVPSPRARGRRASPPSHVALPLTVRLQ